MFLGYFNTAEDIPPMGADIPPVYVCVCVCVCVCVGGGGGYGLLKWYIDGCRHTSS